MVRVGGIVLLIGLLTAVTGIVLFIMAVGEDGGSWERVTPPSLVGAAGAVVGLVGLALWRRPRPGVRFGILLLLVGLLTMTAGIAQMGLAYLSLPEHARSGGSGALLLNGLLCFLSLMAGLGLVAAGMVTILVALLARPPRPKPEREEPRGAN